MLLDIAFVTLAQKTFTGVYTTNQFKKGLDFNKIYKSEIYSNETGWSAKAELAGTKLYEETKLNLLGEGSYSIGFMLEDSSKEPLTNAKVQGKLIRPVTDKYDLFFDFQEESPGVYMARIPIALKGQWHIRIKAEKDSKEYVATYKIINGDV
jgi:nitrogen fixation protein FixH